MYIVKFNFETNNNYRFKYIPCDMKYDGYDSYTLSKSFYNKDEAIDYAVKTADFFFSNITASYTSVNLAISQLQSIKKKLKLFQEEALANRNFNTNSIYIAAQYVDDEDAEFTITEEMTKIHLDIPMTTNEYILFSNNKNDFNNSVLAFASKKLLEYKEKEENNE